MATYVSSTHIQQFQRVRNYLQSYRDRFLNYNYIDGTGAYTSAYPIWINLGLITSKVRPAFMIQWVNFLYPADYEAIMQLLTAYRDDSSLDNRLYFITMSQGILVTTYYTYFKRGLFTRDLTNEVELGSILGYPSTGEHQPIDHPNRYGFGIYVKLTGLDAEQLVGVVYRENASRQRLYDWYRQIKTAVKVYDPEAMVMVEDEQGSLVSAAETYISEYKRRLHISDTEEQIYQEYITSPDRLLENWNNEFDTVFRLGYNYR